MVCRCPFKDFEVFKICCKISDGVWKCTTLPSWLLFMLPGRHQSCDRQGSEENTAPREIINKQQEKEKLPPPVPSFFNTELVMSSHQILSSWYSFGTGKCPNNSCQRSCFTSQLCHQKGKELNESTAPSSTSQRGMTFCHLCTQ